MILTISVYLLIEPHDNFWTLQSVVSRTGPTSDQLHWQDVNWTEQTDCIYPPWLTFVLYTVANQNGSRVCGMRCTMILL